MSFVTSITIEDVLTTLVTYDIPTGNYKVLDVGGGMKPLTYATHVIDMLPYERRSWYGVHGNLPELFTEQTWLMKDLCDTPWPYEDKEFDFVWCTQTIEDLRDPISVIKEISRVGKKGFITTINRQTESSLDVNSPDYAGYIHHRWLIEPDGDRLKFLFKYPLVHVSDTYRPLKTTDPFLNIWWKGCIEGYEKHLYSIQEIEDEFLNYARNHRIEQ